LDIVIHPDSVMIPSGSTWIVDIIEIIILASNTPSIFQITSNEYGSRIIIPWFHIEE